MCLEAFLPRRDQPNPLIYSLFMHRHLISLHPQSCARWSSTVLSPFHTALCTFLPSSAIQSSPVRQRTGVPPPTRPGGI